MNGPIHTRSFKSGNSVAVRLPKSLGVGPDTEFAIEREGERLVLRPIRNADEERAAIKELVRRLREIGPIGESEAREPIEFPDRPGLY